MIHMLKQLLLVTKQHAYKRDTSNEPVPKAIHARLAIFNRCKPKASIALLLRTSHVDDLATQPFGNPRRFLR